MYAGNSSSSRSNACASSMHVRVAGRDYCRSFLLQINGLGETEGETAIDAEHNISIFIFTFPTSTGSCAGSRVSYLADATFGEDAGGLDHDRPAGDGQTHQHDS